MASEHCDHDWESCYCERCGAYQGMKCNHCGAWNDGGDDKAAQPEIWCQCSQEELEELEDE